MNKVTEKAIVVLLILSTAANVVTAAMLVKLARAEFEVELTVDEAQKMMDAAEVAMDDIIEEEGE